MVATAEVRINRWHVPLKRLLRFLLGLFLRIEVEGRALVPPVGALAIYFNHSNWIDPLVAAAVVDREVTILAKAELLRVPIVGQLLRAYGVFPIRRMEGDLRAMKTALGVLQRGGVVIVAPEGTRSRNGALQPGKPGIVHLAARTGAWMQPVAIVGVVDYLQNLRRLRKTVVRVTFGTPYHIPRTSSRPSRGDGQALIDDAMVKLAALMPPELRGVYGDAGR